MTVLTRVIFTGRARPYSTAILTIGGLCTPPIVIRMGTALPAVTPDGMRKLIWYRPTNWGASPENRMSESETVTLPTVSVGRVVVFLNWSSVLRPSATAGGTGPRPSAKIVRISPALAGRLSAFGMEPAGAANNALFANTTAP